MRTWRKVQCGPSALQWFLRKVFFLSITHINSEKRAKNKEKEHVKQHSIEKDTRGKESIQKREYIMRGSPYKLVYSISSPCHYHQHSIFWWSLTITIRSTSFKKDAQLAIMLKKKIFKGKCLKKNFKLVIWSWWVQGRNIFNKAYKTLWITLKYPFTTATTTCMCTWLCDLCWSILAFYESHKKSGIPFCLTK